MHSIWTSRRRYNLLGPPINKPENAEIQLECRDSVLAAFGGRWLSRFCAPASLRSLASSYSWINNTCVQNRHLANQYDSCSIHRSRASTNSRPNACRAETSAYRHFHQRASLSVFPMTTIKLATNLSKGSNSKIFAKHILADLYRCLIHLNLEYRYRRSDGSV